MTEKSGDLDKELDKQLKEYGTSTEGTSTTRPTLAESNDMAENPVGLNPDADRAEESSVETTDEGERTSVEEI